MELYIWKMSHIRTKQVFSFIVNKRKASAWTFYENAKRLSWMSYIEVHVAKIFREETTATNDSSTFKRWKIHSVSQKGD